MVLSTSYMTNTEEGRGGCLFTYPKNLFKMIKIRRA